MRLFAVFLAAWLAQSIGPIGLPIDGLELSDLRDTFNEIHDGHAHEAIDIIFPRGTPVHSVVSGTIRKLFLSRAGGNTIYEFDAAGKYCYYYAHLDHYAAGLREGLHVEHGEIIGFVGSTGNAAPNAPHLHFTVFEIGPAREWWKGKAIDPYTDLVDAVKARGSLQ